MPRKKKTADVSAVEMLGEILKGAQRQQGPKELHVGIRNVSSETISLRAQFGEPSIQLYPTPTNGSDPNATAVIGYPRWQALRRAQIYALGMIVRDDSVLGDVHTRAPEDTPLELHPDHAKNVIMEPHAWIEGRDEAGIREGISRMTSEPSLRRLAAAVDEKIREAQKHIDRNWERNPDAEAQVRQAIESLPWKYQLVERLVENRLEVLNPVQRV